MNAGRRIHWGAALTLVVAAVVAYANTFRVPFVFDDVSSIVDNPTIRRLWPPGEALSPPPDWGVTVSGRPILNLSFAINYAIGGLNVEGYHAVNLGIHALAGLTLFSLVRRTLGFPRLAPHFEKKATPVAFAIALIWMLHPLQTEAVTYVVQRAESLMGLFFLLTLFAFARAVGSSRPRLWWALSFLACLLGVGTKEVAALAPIVGLLYDRTFVSGSFPAAWRRHWGWHLSLAATWLPLGWLLAGTGGNRGGTIGFDVGISWSAYWLTQFEAVTRYLGLTFWPHPLVFDYGKVGAPSIGAAVLWAVPVVGLGSATCVGLWRWPVAGFLGFCFFGLLAPTSLVPGALQMIVEHRLYLPLAAVLSLVLGTLATRCRTQTFLTVVALLALGLGGVTARRNAVYRDEQELWQDTLAKRPANARAHNNLGLLLYRGGRLDEAIEHYQESLRLDPSDAHTHYNLGLALMKTGRTAEAVAPLTEAIRVLPYFFNARLNLGMVLTKLGRPGEALPHFTEALRFDPSPSEVHFQLGVALAELGRWPEAVEHYAQALRIDPRHAEAQSNWGVALVRMGSVAAALGHFHEALRLKPELTEAHFNLALALSQLGRRDEAISHYASAVRLDPAHADAHLNLGIALAQNEKLPEGIGHLERAVSLRPDSPEAHANLALALLTANRTVEALPHYETALRLRPGDARAHYNLGYALLILDRRREAQSHFEEALKIQPGFATAREMLQRLQGSMPR